MLSKTFRNLSKGVAHNNLKSILGNTQRAFSSPSVTYDFKDLILDPEQKGKPIYSLYKLQESQMPMKATTNKDELMGYLKRMI